MKTIRLILVTLCTLLTISMNAAPTVGSDAPDFQLQDQYGKLHSLNDYKGKWLVLYFYPRDNTPGCTVEAGKFRDSAKELADRNAVVLGVSLDDVESHLDFSKTLELNFSILSDEKRKVAKSYEVLTNLGIVAYTSRETFIIDPSSRVAHHFDDVSPKTHTETVLKKLDELKELYK